MADTTAGVRHNELGKGDPLKNDRLGFLLIAASLVVIVIVGGLLYQQQVSLHDDKTRVHGVALTRALAASDFSKLALDSDKGRLIRNLVNVQDNEDFAYVLVMNPAGGKLVEHTSLGSIAPPATMPSEPYAWFGEHQLNSPGDGRAIREFFAPVMSDGQLGGFVRAGYYRKTAQRFSKLLSSFAVMALPIFLLTTLSYLLIRREIRPLNQLCEKMEQAARSYGVPLIRSAPQHNLDSFIQRFDQFIQMVQSRAQQTEQAAFSTQTTTHLLAFKQEKAESALNSIPDAVLVVDDAGIPSFANQKIEPLLGVKLLEVIGQPPQAWCANKDILAFLLRFKSAPTAMRATGMEYVAEGNPERRIAVGAFPLYSPRDHAIVFGMLIVFRDVSKEHLAKQAGTEFVSHVSHELKTPLNTLAAYSELLLDRASLSEAEQVDAVNVIHAEVARMSGLINNLLNISKMETGTLQLERKRVKVHNLMQDAFDSITKHALGQGVKLELHIPPDLGSVRLDKDMFRIAIDNLLSNAVKYSDPGGKVTLHAQHLDDGQIHISVRDQGIGIAPEERDKVFQKYYRVSSSETASRSGHGLGLYLVKQIIDLHHGTITVNSELGKGTEFIISFKAQSVQLEESLA